MAFTSSGGVLVANKCVRDVFCVCLFRVCELCPLCMFCKSHANIGLKNRYLFFLKYFDCTKMYCMQEKEPFFDVCKTKEGQLLKCYCRAQKKMLSNAIFYSILLVFRHNYFWVQYDNKKHRIIKKKNYLFKKETYDILYENHFSI